MTGLIEQLNAALERCRREEYMVSVYWFGGTDVRVSLSKDVYGSGASVKTEGKGPTVEAAFKAAFDNFPKNPLDGSTWASKQLAKPEAVKDAVFTETKDTSDYDIPF